MHQYCRRRKEKKKTKQDCQNKSLNCFYFFVISGMLIEESLRGIISNLQLSGNIKIYETDLTVLIGIMLLVDVNLVCAPLSLNAFQHFLINVKSSL